ncbi:hypothetical protein ABZ816_34105 [Actinosynnema sp. NPDC047251]|uniref:hypothetical protein n=1 Tax=Saccharothrix espanaensis TaxID=103731 RepID=UPI0002DA88C6|nr:hypothetical protein [Saccharothrix espanaensis]
MGETGQDWAARLAKALRARDRDRATAALVEEAGAAPAPALRDRYRDDPRSREALRHVLAAAGGWADAVVGDLLSDAVGDDASELLHLAVRRRTAVAPQVLARLLDDPSTVRTAVVAAGSSGHRELAPAVAAHLGSDHGGLAAAAAYALAGLRATGSTAAILDRAVRGRHPAKFLSALVLMDDPAAVRPLLEWLPTARDADVQDVHDALSRLTGREPAIPEDGPQRATAIRRAWAGFDPAAPPAPRVDGPERLPDGTARATVDFGAGLVRIEHDPPEPGEDWVRWDLSLFVGRRRVYGIGSGCGTCEAYLHLVGWPDDRATELADDVRAHLRDVPSLTDGLLAAVRPVLAGLRSGEYRLVLADLPLERVEPGPGTWFTRRHALRSWHDPDLRELRDEADLGLPGTTHFQVPERIPGHDCAFGVVVPTQPLDALAEDVVARHGDAIAAGARPTAILFAWADDRDVACEHPEQFLHAVILDGHHRLTAYARAGVPARVLVVSRLANNWGPPEDRARVLLDLLAPFRVT